MNQSFQTQLILGIINFNNYSGIYSNENNIIPGTRHQEKIYFDTKAGLIAVRDSLGVLWTRG